MSARFHLDVRARTLSLDPRDPAFVQDPYAVYATLHDACPVVYWRELGFWCLAGHGAVSALLRDRRFGRQVLHVATREALGWPEPAAHLAPILAFEQHSLLELEPPAHTRLRGLVSRAFTPRQIESLAPRIEAIAHHCIDGFPAAGRFDLLEHYATPVPVRVIAGMLGVPEDMMPQLLDWSHDMVAIYQARRDEAIERRAAAATEAFSAYVRGLIATRRDAPGDDLLSALIDALDDGERLSEDELVSTVILLLNAGHEATVHAIGNAVKALIEHSPSDVSQPVHPPSSAALVEETLRYDPPLHLFTRYALEDVELEGIRVRRGDRIGVLLGAANRDPSRFIDPDLFDPARSPNPHVSFGAGIHFCLGAPLARMEIGIALRVLFERHPGLRLAGAPRYRDAWHFHGLESLPIQA